MVDLKQHIPGKTAARELVIRAMAFKGLAGVSRAHRATDDRIRQKALAADLVTFDVFDTAIVRALAAPVDLFEFLGHPAADFKRARIDAERRAVQAALASGLDEVTIGEIHELARWPQSSVSGASPGVDLVADEIVLEHRFCRAHPPAFELFNELVGLGRPPVFISDTYFDQEEIVALLEVCGFSGWADVIVSSAHRRTKRSGELFDVAASRLGKPSRWFHLGDTLTPDVLSARRRGIIAGYIPRPIDQLRILAPSFESVVRQSVSSQVATVVVGLVANALAADGRVGVGALERTLGRFAGELEGSHAPGSPNGLAEQLAELVAWTEDDEQMLILSMRDFARNLKGHSK